VGVELGLAFITGGNRGIGAATAQVLAAAGHRVVIGSRSGERSATRESQMSRLMLATRNQFERGH